MKLSLSELADLAGGKISQQASDTAVSGVASLSEATALDVSFLGNEKYFPDFLETKAGVVLIPANLPQIPKDVSLIEVENPSFAFNAVVKHFSTVFGQKPTFGAHPSAVIDPSANIDLARVSIGAHVVIGAEATIGAGTILKSGVIIEAGVEMGEDCLVHSGVVVRERCLIGNRVILQPNCVIGADGFGYEFSGGQYLKIDQVGIVQLDDDVEIGANTTIDRARFGRTIIGQGSKIDNLVQIGHNVIVGKHCIIVSLSGIAGSTQIGDYVTIAAQVGIAGHLKIGSKATLGAKSGVISDLEGGKYYWGSPCSPLGEAKRQFAALRRLPDLMKEFSALKKRFLG